MDVEYPPEAEAFRTRIRAFLAEHLPNGWSGIGALPPAQREAFAQRWRRTLADCGLIAVSWPKQYGGGGLSAIEQAVLAEEFARAGAPERAENDLLGIDLLGNAVIALGSQEQKTHFLPRILSAEDRWCQGFSEPEAGSDLAAVRTRAMLDGDEWVINGQKIWTSAGSTANWIFLLARTNVDLPKHEGLSLLLVPIDQSGVTVRPIVNAAGHGSFSEVFLTDARTPVAHVVGGVGNGWSAAMTVLGFERGSQVTTAAIEFGRDLERLSELARQRGLHTDPRIRDALAWCYSRVQIMRYRGYRALTSLLNGADRAPTPRSRRSSGANTSGVTRSSPSRSSASRSSGPKGRGTAERERCPRRARRTRPPAGATNCSTRAPRPSTRAARRSSAT